MKRMLGLLFLLLVGGVITASAATGELTVVNPQVSGNQVSFDVYLRSTTTSTLYLTDVSLYFSFDGSKFTNPSSSFTSNLSATYDPGSIIYNTNPKRVGVEIVFTSSPTTTNTQIIAASGNGTKLGTVTLTGLTNLSGNLGLAWGLVDPFSTKAFSWDPQSNMESEIITNPVAPPTISLAPVFEAIIVNQQLLNNEYTYDVYLRRTGGSAFYLDDMDFISTFNNVAFSGGAAHSLVSAGTTKINDFYTFQNFSIVGNEIRWSVSGPTVSTQGEFNQRVQQIAGPGDSTYVGRFKISNALPATTVSDVTPSWKTAGTPPRTVVYSRQSSTPWSSDDVSANGTYIVRAPEFTITLTAPVGGEVICPGTNTGITWTSMNIANVSIVLLQSGSTVATLTASTSAATGSFTWAVPGNLASGSNYRIRISDASDAGHSSESADFTVGSAPAITGQPSPLTVVSGSTATLTVMATGTNLTYQWQVETTGGTFVNVGSASTSNTLTFNPAAVNNSGNYRAVVSGSCAPAATSATALLTVLPQGVSVTVTAYLQGMWNGTSHISSPVAVELRSGATLPASTLVSRTTGMLSTVGTITADFSGVVAGDYWVVVRSGGYLPVGSSTVVALTPGSTATYNFTDDASKAAGNGTTAVTIGSTTYYVLKAGDFNGDRAANPTDIPIMLFGYPKTNASSVPAVD